MLQLGIIFFFTVFFLALERISPGRALPPQKGWYPRAFFLNACQLGVTILAAHSWQSWMQGWSFFDTGLLSPISQGLIGWFLGTFVFYWWHRARHKSDLLWHLFHQIHHSPARIEVLTAFYKHPLEIIADSILSSFVMFVLLGASLDGALWFNVFAAVGEYFYHANIKTPRWMGYFIQRPEHHSIHHQLDVHHYNYGDIPIWDRLFGTFKEAEDFVPICGFPSGREQALGKMLAFKRNYN